MKSMRGRTWLNNSSLQWLLSICVSTEKKKHNMRVVKVKVALSCLTLCNPINCSPQAPLSMVFSRQEHWRRCHALLQGSNPVVSYMAGRFFNVWATREVFGANEDYSPGESIPDSSEKLLHRGRGKVSIYMISVTDRGSCSQAHVLVEVCC